MAQGSNPDLHGGGVDTELAFCNVVVFRNAIYSATKSQFQDTRVSDPGSSQSLFQSRLCP